jgi:CheY-like chemotaxis protein
MKPAYTPAPKSIEARPLPPDFLHKTKHDIHGALHVVTGIAKVLSMSDTLPPSQKEMVALLKKNADLTVELIDSLFDFIEAAGELTDVSAPNERLHVLLVDDSAPSAQVGTSFLKELGYDCDVARSGQEALIKFSTGHYDVVLMDVQMPGMDGLETSRRIRFFEKENNRKPTPIIATTGDATQDDLLFCLKAGMNDSLSKPFEIEDLRGKIKDVMACPVKN